MKTGNKFLILMVILSMVVLVACGTETDDSDADENPTEVITETTDEETPDEVDTDETEDENTEEEDSEAMGLGNTFTLTGTDIDFAIDGFASGSDYDPVGNDFSSFDVLIRPEDGFVPALSISGIPRSASAGDVITLGNPVTAIQACIFFQEGMNMADTFSVITTSGSITLTDFDGTTASGTFEAVMVAATSGTCVDTVGGNAGAYTSVTADGVETYTLTGSFTDITVPSEDE